jgi:hypothetical protein
VRRSTKIAKDFWPVRSARRLYIMARVKGAAGAFLRHAHPLSTRAWAGAAPAHQLPLKRGARTSCQEFYVIEGVHPLGLFLLGFLLFRPKLAQGVERAELADGEALAVVFHG